jgi:O-antigen/teichoic acid export membrane protein
MDGVGRRGATDDGAVADMTDSDPSQPENRDAAEAAKTESTSQNIRSIAKGSGFLAAGDLFNYVSRAVAAFVLARALEAHDYGIYNIAVSMAFVFSGIADFGLNAAMERFIPVFRKKDDHGGVRGTLQLGVGVTALGALGFGLTLLVLSPLLADRVFDEPELETLFRLFALIVPIMALTDIIGAIARGYKRMDYYAFSYDFIQPLVRVALVVLFAFIGLNPLIASLIFGVSYLAALIVLVRLVRRERRNSTPVEPARRDTRDVTFFALPFWFTSLMTKVRRNIQSLLLGAFDTATSVGVFSLAGSANLVGRISNLAISTSMRPVLAELFDSGDHREMDRLYKTTTRWTLTLNLPIFVVMVVFAEPILALFGESYVTGATALVILAGSELANAITGTCGAVVDMSGRGKMKVANKAVMIALLIGGNLLLIPPFGVIGAAIAVLFANLTINVIRIVEVRWFARMQPYDLRILKPLAAAAMAFGAGYALLGWIGTDISVGLLVVGCLAIGITYLLGLILLGLPDEERSILRQLLSRMRRRRKGEMEK